MPLTPSQILSANQAIFGGGGGGGVSALRASRAQKQDELEKLLEQEEEKDDGGGGIWDTIKSTTGTVIKPVASLLDMPRAAVVAGVVEGGDLLANLAGADNADDASWSDLRENFNRRIGVGDVIEESVAGDLPMPIKRLLGGAGDLSLDPLNYLTAGASTTAKAGLKRLAVEGGDEAARVLAREGVDAADDLLARQFADDVAATASNRIKKSWGVPVDPTAPVVAKGATAPTVRGILGEGATQRGLGRTLEHIERSGRGGLALDFGRLGSARIPGSVFGREPALLAAGAKAGSDALRTRPFGQAVRKAIVPYTATRDKFGQAIAEALPGIGHRRAALVDSAKLQLDQRIEPLLKAAKPDADMLGAMRAALDVGGDVDNALLQLDGLPEAQELLTEMAAVRDETYDAWLRAGKDPKSLLPKEEYLRHRLTEAGKEMFGIEKRSLLPGTKSGKLKKRVFDEESIDELNEWSGIAGWEDDPVKLVGSSWNYAHEVLGNAGAFDALENVASKIRGFDVGSVVSRKAKKGFVEIGPNRWVAPEIYDDLFNLAKAGTQSSIIRGWDTFSSLVKRQTLFNPIAFGPYFSQNMATGVAMNAARFGVGPQDYARLYGIRRAFKQAAKAGEKDLDATLATLLTGDDLELARALRSEGIFSTQHSLFDDIAEGSTPFVKPGKARRVAEFGTHKTAAANQFGEEMLRGSAFMKSMERGIPANQASDLVRSTHLDYTALGRTRFERDKINRFIFFPTWLLRAPSAIVRTYAHRPALFNVQAKMELGENWSERPRNQYGDIIGSRWSGPTSFLTGLGFEGGDAFDKPTELLHPVLQAALDEDSRRVTDILPPLSNVLSDEGNPVPGPMGGKLGFGGRLGKIIDGGLGGEPLERYGKGLGGFRYGVDYDAERGAEAFQTQIDERRAEIKAGADKPETTPKIRLVLAALAEGIPAAEAYTASKAELARALLDAGLSEDDVNRILEDDDAKLPK